MRGLKVGIGKHAHLCRIQSLEFLLRSRTDGNDQVAEFHPCEHDDEGPSNQDRQVDDLHEQLTESAAIEESDNRRGNTVVACAVFAAGE